LLSAPERLVNFLDKFSESRGVGVITQIGRIPEHNLPKYLRRAVNFRYHRYAVPTVNADLNPYITISLEHQVQQMRIIFSGFVLSAILVFIAGCSRSPNTPDPTKNGGAPTETTNVTKRKPVEWVEEGLEQGESSISLGYLTTEGGIEPIAKIARGKESAADAMVFHSLVNANGEVISDEVATVYETADTLYAQGKHKSADLAGCSIRFRIVLAGQPEAVVTEIAIGDDRGK
jgi:hypothetical protein